MKRKLVAEQFMEADGIGSVAGGSSIPDPVDTGDAHALRPQDNLQGEQGTAEAPGQGTISRSQILGALIQKLSGMDVADLSRVANTFDATTDLNSHAGNSAASGNANAAAVNQASISVKEDVAELLADQELSEDVRARTAVVFEGAVNARVAIIEAELTERSETQISEAVENLTNEFVSQLDRYASYVAEQYVQDNVAAIEATVRSTIAEEFMTGVLALAERFNVDLPDDKVDLVEQMQVRIRELESRLDEKIESQVRLSEQIAAFEHQAIIDEVGVGLGATQKVRLQKLAEGVDAATADDYRAKVELLRESVVRVAAPARTPAPALITEDRDGVSPLSTPEVEPAKSNDPAIRGVVQALSRINKTY